MYDSWASCIRLFIKGKKHGRMMIDSIDKGPLVYLTVEENGQTRPKKYSKLTEAQQIQDDCDVQATNIILHSPPPNVYALFNHQEAAKDIWDKVKMLMKGTGLSYQEHEYRLYNLFDKFAYQGKDPIECINKAMALLFAVASRKNTKNLNTKISKLNEELSDRENNVYHYKIGLSQVEARLVEFKTQEIKFREKTRGLERDVEVRNNKIEYLMNELEHVKKEKKGLDNKLTGFESASKDLDTLLGSQRTDKNKKGLPEFIDDTVTDYSRPTPSIDSSKSDTSDLQNSNFSVSKQGVSSSSIMSKPMIKFVKAANCPGVFKTNKTKTARKSPVKYAETYRNTSKNPKVRDKITEVQIVFNQMEVAVDQYSVDKNIFEIQIKQLRIDIGQLFNQIISQEIVHIVANFVDILEVKKSCVNDCNKCLELEIELFKKKDFVEKESMFDEFFSPPISVVSQALVVDAPALIVLTGSPSSTTVDQDAHSSSNSQTTPQSQSQEIPLSAKEDSHDLKVAHMSNDPYFGIPIPETIFEESSSMDVVPKNMHSNASISKHLSK
uniref:Uncharacterized protein n=1 Tax=Tanacetum cinerariifolium TaxID=118510 RepID=A0A6L2KDJ8_TANCI|nr:hypothetical protein [Tanacetum cinerariifolium]